MVIRGIKQLIIMETTHTVTLEQIAMANPLVEHVIMGHVVNTR